MNVRIIPALGDNYIYLLHGNRSAGVIDPAHASPVLAALDEMELKLDIALVTHGHFDHTGGCDDLVRATGCVVAGPGRKRVLTDGDAVPVTGADLRVMSVPGHTSSDVAYYAPEQRMIWTGDVLFAAGCGRIFGGGAKQMWESLKKIRALPDDVTVYCGHEYTEENLEFAVHLEPKNEVVARRLAQVRELRRKNRPRVPSSLGLEKTTNPFLRSDSDAMKRAVGLPDASPVEVFAELRRRKDRW